MCAASPLGPRVGSPPQAPQPVTVEATWSNWWGSPQLVASVVSTAEAALSSQSSQATSSIAVLAGGYEGLFANAESFVGGVPPEFLSSLREIVAVSKGEVAGMDFTLSRKRRWFGSSDDGARLRVTASTRAASDRLLEALVPAAARGYQPYWGPCKVPNNVTQPDWVYRKLKAIRVVLNLIAAAVIGAAVFLATARFSIPGPVALGAFVLGALTPTLIDSAVPKVEIAASGRTRLRVMLARLIGAVLTAVGAAVVGLFLGN
jgi:hypothetical protein